MWPPPEVCTQVGAEVVALAAAAPGLRWVPSEQMHITLAFLGEVTPEQCPELERRLARVSERYAPMTLHLAGAGRFGSRALFLRPAGDLVPLGRLGDSAGAAARRAGLKLQDRPFRAHLTLARARPGADLGPMVTALEQYRGTVWTANEMHLVRSRLGAGPGGRPSYETIMTWPLAGRPG